MNNLSLNCMTRVSLCIFLSAERVRHSTANSFPIHTDKTMELVMMSNSTQHKWLWNWEKLYQQKVTNAFPSKRRCYTCPSYLLIIKRILFVGRVKQQPTRLILTWYVHVHEKFTQHTTRVSRENKWSIIFQMFS